MSFIIDRRLNTNKKSSENSQRFKERYKKNIQQAVKKAISKGNVTDIIDNKEGIDVTIDKEDLNEPTIQNDTRTGKREDVYTGNKEFLRGDKIPNPNGGQGGQGSGSGEGAGNSDEVSEDEFKFQINHEEFLNYLFEELALPELVKKSLARTKQIGIKKNGYSRYGIQANLDVQKSLKESIGRKMALKGMYNREIEEIQNSNLDNKSLLIEELEKKKNQISYIEENDLRYKINTPIKKPITSAVMFCLMDVSASVTEEQKELSKRFYILLYLFLKRNYEDIDVRFIRYTTIAKDVDEREFFYSTETGGTRTSCAIELTNEIIDNEYPEDEWNIYIAHTSDGDNWADDNKKLLHLLESNTLKRIQYYSYVEVNIEHRSSDMKGLYDHLSSKYEKVKSANISKSSDVYPALKFLFNKNQGERK